MLDLLRAPGGLRPERKRFRLETCQSLKADVALRQLQRYRNTVSLPTDNDRQGILPNAVVNPLTGARYAANTQIPISQINRFAADVFWVYIKVANAIPRVVLAPVFILIFGLGLWSKVALSFVMVFFVVFSNAFQGVREADRALIANAQILGASHWQITRSVVLPSAMSWIFASLHVSFGFAIIGAIVGEFVGSREGIGLLIQVASGSFDAAGIFAAIVLIVAIALIAEYAMTAVENRLLKWRPTPFHDLNG